MSPLTSHEQTELIRLMDKLAFPVPEPVFEAWCRVFGTVVVEVVVIRENKKTSEIFLEYREDKFFKGWYIPGCVHLPQESFQDTLRRVLKKELHIKSCTTKFFGWFERPYGDRKGQSKRGHETSLVFVCRAKQTLKENDMSKFFALPSLPKNIMHHQLPIIKNLKKSFLK